MKATPFAIASGLAMMSWTGVDTADPWKIESGHAWRDAYKRGGDFDRERYAHKEEFYRDGCKIERKWDSDEYEEETKCKGGWDLPR